MRHALLYALVLALASAPTAVVASADEARDVYELVTAASVPLLPASLRATFTERLPAIRAVAARDLCPDVDAGGSAGSATSHYIRLGAIAAQDVRRFPRDRASALKQFRSRGVHDGGELPWVLLDHHADLVDAFRKNSWDGIVEHAGCVLHFATDANLPFSTVSDADARRGAALHWPAEEGERADEPHRHIRRRFQVELPRRMRDRLSYELRVFPGRYRDVEDVPNAVFGVVFAAHDSVDDVVAIDRRIMSELDITDATTFRSHRDAYYDQMSVQAGSIVVARLKSAALLSAELIGAAWRDAGSPELAAANAPALPREDERADAGSLVGSRNSGKYHRSSCQHAKRIKPANLVRFDSAKAAGQAGRTPCRTCRPGK